MISQQDHGKYKGKTYCCGCSSRSSWLLTCLIDIDIPGSTMPSSKDPRAYIKAVPVPVPDQPREEDPGSGLGYHPSPTPQCRVQCRNWDKRRGKNVHSFKLYHGTVVVLSNRYLFQIHNPTSGRCFTITKCCIPWFAQQSSNTRISLYFTEHVLGDGNRTLTQNINQSIHC